MFSFGQKSSYLDSLDNANQKFINSSRQQNQTTGFAKNIQNYCTPAPVLKVGNKLATSNLEFTKNELAAIGGLGAESPRFMFPVNMILKSFSMVIMESGVLFPTYLMVII